MLTISRHRRYLVKILKEIYTTPSIRTLLGFKGGTAAYLFYGLSRFSVDLDFDLLDESKETQVLQKLKERFSKMKNVKLKQAYNKRYNIFFLLSYKDEDHNIKVEISKRNFGSSYEVKNYLGIPMLVMKKEDVVANKLVALTERKKEANRDLYDVWFFLSNDFEINEEIIKERSGLSPKAYLTKCIKFVQSTKNRHILQGMGELFNAKQKFWVKNNLLDDLVFQLKLRRDSF